MPILLGKFSRRPLPKNTHYYYYYTTIQRMLRRNTWHRSVKLSMPMLKTSEDSVPVAEKYLNTALSAL